MKLNLNNTPYGRFACLLFDLILLNILFIITSLPILTIGASSTALYYTLSQRRRGEDSMTKTFLIGFKRNAIQATCIWLLLFVLGGILCYNFYIASLFKQNQAIVIAILSVPAFLYCCIISYTFPLLGEFEHTNIQLLTNSTLMSFAHFPKTILLVSVNLFPVIVLLVLPSWIGGMLFIWLPCIFSLCAYLNTNILSSVFEPYHPEALESEDHL